MIKVSPVPKPQDFDREVAEKGNVWLSAHPSGRPPAYWRPYKPVLADGFSNLCGYSAMYEPIGTVDHFVAVADDRTRAYDWDNYRFSSQSINSTKSRRRNAAQVLDPYTVEDNWFEMILPLLQLQLTDKVPSSIRARAEYTLERLKLRDGEAIIRQRRKWMEEYERTHDIGILDRNAPLLAAAVRNQINKAQSGDGA